MCSETPHLVLLDQHTAVDPQYVIAIAKTPADTAGEATVYLSIEPKELYVSGDVTELLARLKPKPPV